MQWQEEWGEEYLGGIYNGEVGPVGDEAGRISTETL